MVAGVAGGITGTREGRRAGEYGATTGSTIDMRETTTERQENRQAEMGGTRKRRDSSSLPP